MDEIISFGPFELHPTKRLLSKGGDPVQIGSRALDVLIALVQAGGNVVSQKDLIARAWPNVVVGEGSLRVTVAELRKLLGDGQDGVRYIANVTGRGYCFVASVQQPAVVSSAPASPTHERRLPMRLTRMVGREEAVESLAQLLLDKRFVSIVGPGGMGKTTLAVALAHRLAHIFPNGACFVDLGALNDMGLVGNAIAAELGVSVTTEDALPGLMTYLAQRKLLLVLDNCEHVIDAAAAFAEQIFNEAREVHILTTTREILRADGEQVYLLSPLDCPREQSGLTAREAMMSPAVQLFMDRAFASGHAVSLTDAEAPIVAGMCGRLDGIALAIELAGSRVGTYGLVGTADLLNHSFQLFWRGRRSAPPRHQTLHAMLDWSFNLLCERERRVLARLSVFIGSFTLEAAQAVVSDAQLDIWGVADCIVALVGKSLITVSQVQGVPVYRLLDSTAAFAAEKLALQGDAKDVSRRHAVYFMQWGLAVAPDNHVWFGHGPLEHIEPQIGNIREALDWSFSSEGDIEIGVRLVAAAAPLFFALSSLTECRKWCDAGLAAHSTAKLGDCIRLPLQATLAAVAMFTLGNGPEVLASLEECLALAERLGRRDLQLHFLAGVHIFHVRSYNVEGVLTAAQRAASLAGVVNTQQAKAMAQFLLGIAHHVAGHQLLARDHCERGLKQSADLNSSEMVFFGHDQRIRGLQVLGRSLWLLGLPDQAALIAQKAVGEAKAQNHPVILCMTLLYCISVFLWNGDLERAEALIAELVSSASTHGLRPYRNVGLAQSGELAFRRGDTARGLGLLKEALGLLEGGHFYTLCLAIHGTIVEGLIAAGQYAEAAAFLEAAFSRPYATSADKYMPELLRLQGEVCRCHGEQASLAEETFQRAISLARASSALSFELRAAMSLSRLLASTGRSQQALDLLQEVYGRFSEGFETVDLQVARQLLDDFGDHAAAARWVNR